jgi:ABC-type amino acid transport substrate-binding protein
MTRRAGLLLILAVLLAGCAGQEGVRAAPSPTVGSPDELRVGIAPTYPPLAFKESGELKGVEVDLARQIAGGLRMKPVFVELPWDQLIPALLARRIDVIMAGMSITEERRALLTFTEPYLQVGQMALIRMRDAGRLAGPGAMAVPGRRIGVEQGTTGEQYATRSLAGAGVTRFESVARALQALQAGSIDYLIHDAPTIWHLTGNPQPSQADLLGLFTPLTEEYLAWAVRRGDDPLRQKLNVELARLRERGELSAILTRWIPTRIEIAPIRRTQ